jgi:hypothetical protein
MLDALSQRTVVIGNSGSDKSTLAEHLAARSKIPDEAVSFVAP